VKWVSAIIFIYFGFAGLYQALPAYLLSIPNIVGAVLLVLLLIYLVNRIGRDRQPVEE
jgi:putative Mn2+ efflux pump MntP